MSLSRAAPGHTLDVRLTRDKLTVRSRDRNAPPIRLGFRDGVHTLAGGDTRSFAIPAARD